MSVNKENYSQLVENLTNKQVQLVAVSKTKPIEDILALYNLGQRDFGENYVQELVDKEAVLPKDIRWHFIGHLQSNKVKYIVTFVHLIHGIDSFKLLKEVNKQAGKINRMVDCLLQVHIAEETTKFGFDEGELFKLSDLAELQNIRVIGLMGMASFIDNKQKVRSEFKTLKKLFNQFAEKYPNCTMLSMGMSGDYEIAMEEGSNLLRIGSLLFGERV